jgi:glycosyltransferase involved in cell wall biosynthesis
VRFSILLATLDRTREVDHFLQSLARQTWRDFDVLVVDQNSDDRLKDILDRYAGQFPIQHLRCARGHSKAFNFGLLHAAGDIVAFPDDDCWYDPDLLERVHHAFESHQEAIGITGREIVEPGFLCGGRWDVKAGRITRSNVWRRAISFSVFLRRAALQGVSFDETLGVGAGTPWGAGEETDYLLHLIERGNHIDYDPSIAIWHQGRSGPYTPQAYTKAQAYGMGMGRVLRKHSYPAWSVAHHLVRPLGGALQAAATARFPKARYHWSVFAGRIRGWAMSVKAPEPLSRSLVSRSEDVT